MPQTFPPKQCTWFKFPRMHTKQIWYKVTSRIAKTSLHYRLRWPFGIQKCRKKCKSNSLFLIHFWYHTPKKCLFGATMTQILHRKKIRKILEDKICQQFQKTPKKVEGGLSGSWNFAWWKKGSCRVKKLKIATSTEAPFKVKMDF